MPDVRRNRARDISRAAPAESGCHSNVLLASHRERDRETLYGGAETDLPKLFARPNVVCVEVPIEIAREHHSATCRERCCKKRRALLDAPDLAHGVHIERSKLADVAVRARHFVEATVAGGAAGPLLEFHLAAREFHARLRQRNDEEPCAGVVARRVPVVAAFGTRARLHPISDLRRHDLGPVSRHAGFEIDAIKHVVENRLFECDVFAALAIDLPQDPRLADCEHELPAAHVDEHALVDLVQIERLARRMLEEPGKLAAIGSERDSRTRVEHAIRRLHVAARRHPWLRLRHAPVSEIEIGVVAAGYPGLATLAERVGDVTPGVAAALPALRHRVEPPQLLPGVRIVGADVTPIRLEPGASGQALQNFAADDDRSAAVGETLVPLSNRNVPHEFARAGIKSRQSRITGGHEHLVLIDGDIAHRARGFGTDVMLPDQLARAPVKGLDDVAGINQVNDAVMSKWSRLALRSEEHTSE